MVAGATADFPTGLEGAAPSAPVALEGPCSHSTGADGAAPSSWRTKSDDLMKIRPEEPSDRAQIARLNRLAFGQPAEADLVDRLRAAGRATVTLVAEDPGERVVGHILFSPVTLDPAPDTAPPWLGLAPMAVLPERQRQGVGAALVRAGLAAARRTDATAVVVLGHPEYYPRFGFAPASRFGLRCVYDAPDEAFLALELVPGGFGGRRGLVRYAAEFDLL